jgi:putrescine:ornithine antiporter
MAYCFYAIYAAGKDAVFIGVLVVALGYAVWGFIARRFGTVRKPAALAA